MQCESLHHCDLTVSLQTSHVSLTLHLFTIEESDEEEETSSSSSQEADDDDDEEEGVNVRNMGVAKFGAAAEAVESEEDETEEEEEEEDESEEVTEYESIEDEVPVIVTQQHPDGNVVNVPAIPIESFVKSNTAQSSQRTTVNINELPMGIVVEPDISVVVDEETMPNETMEP